MFRMNKLNGKGILDSSLGQINGIADLNEHSKVPSSRLPILRSANGLSMDATYQNSIVEWANEIAQGGYRPTIWQDLELQDVGAVFKVDERTLLIFTYSETSPNCYYYDVSTGNKTSAQKSGLKNVYYGCVFNDVWYICTREQTLQGVRLRTRYSTDKGATWLTINLNTNAILYQYTTVITPSFMSSYNSNTSTSRYFWFIDGSTKTIQSHLQYYDYSGCICFSPDRTEYFAIWGGTSDSHLEYYDGTTGTDITPPYSGYSNIYVVLYFKGVLAVLGSNSHVSKDKGQTWQSINLHSYSGGSSTAPIILPDESYAYFIMRTSNYSSAPLGLYGTTDGENFVLIITFPSAQRTAKLQYINGQVFVTTTTQLYIVEGLIATLLYTYANSSDHNVVPYPSFVDDAYFMVTSTYKAFTCTPTPLFLD